MTIRELVRTDVITVEPGTSVQDIAKRMRDEKVGSVVVEEGGKPVGIVTDRDLALRILGDGEDPSTLSAEDVMTRDPATADMDDGVYDLVSRMCEAEVRRMPVTENGSLAGIITMDDLLVLLSSEFSHMASVVQAESPPY